MSRFTLTDGGFNSGPWRHDLERRLIRASQIATDKGSLGARDDQRTAMRSQRLGGLANAIKQTSDLKKNRFRGEVGGKWSASGVIYAHIRSERTEGALDAYTQGASIVPRKGRWLAIATNKIPNRVGRFRMTPERYREGGFESSIGPLVFIQGSRAGEAYLIAKNVSSNQRKRGSARSLLKGGRARRGGVAGDVVAFVLIKATRRTKRVNIAEIMNQWQLRIPGMVGDAYDRLTK